jgi:hypothetical protein
VSILTSDGVTDDVNSNCDGSDTTVMANRFCLVPMSSLREAPFNLVLDDLVVAIITATNEIGTSDPSDENTDGAVVMTEPAAQSDVVRDDSGTSDLQITVNFPI